MSRPRRKAAPRAAASSSGASASTAGDVQAFSFGDPEPVLDRRDLLGVFEAWDNGKWFEPPIAPIALAKAFDVGPHHASAIYMKRNMVVRGFKPSRLLSRSAFSSFVLDYLVFGNTFLERADAYTRRPLKLRPSPALFTRRGKIDGQYFFVPRTGIEHEFALGTVFQLSHRDVKQEIYGVPEYLGGLQSAFLNENATLFRRRYYLNGSHAGFIMYMTDAAQQATDIDRLREALRTSKGPGNFRNLFLYAPGGKKDGLQLIPVSEVAAKDEFFNIKNVTRDDVLAAHRTPPQLIGVVPSNTGGFGDVSKAADVFHYQEIDPLRSVFLEVNDWVGEEAVAFDPYTPISTPAPAKAA